MAVHRVLTLTTAACRVFPDMLESSSSARNLQTLLQSK